MIQVVIGQPFACTMMDDQPPTYSWIVIDSHHRPLSHAVSVASAGAPVASMSASGAGWPMLDETGVVIGCWAGGPTYTEDGAEYPCGLTAY